MFSRSLFAGTALATILALWGSSAAVAAPIDFGGYTGPVTIKFSDFENFSAGQTINEGGTLVPAPGTNSVNFGIFVITSVNVPNILNTGTYSYVGVFTGITTTAVQPFAGPNPSGWTSTTTGGVFELFQIPTADLTSSIFTQGNAGYTAAGCAIGSLCYNGITNIAGFTNPVLVWDINGSLTPSYTYTDANAGIVNTGHSSALATIVGGTDASQFGPLLNISNDFCFSGFGGTGECVGTSTTDPWAVLSQDPVIGRVVSAPEPGSLALLGSGLLGLGVFRRRRRKGKTSAG